MATVKISALPAAIGIDGVADYLPIVQSGVTNKINRNILLGLASAPLGTTDSQSPTNKTFDNTNSLTIKDGSLTLQNTSDTTKRAVFSLSGITTSTTRTITVPDASLTLVGTATTQTLTNKTLTSPTITGGTIDNSTITVDSIAGHTSSTIVTVANLQISNGVLNSANAVTATSIAAGAVQPQALVTGTGTGWSWSSWSPSYVNLTVGNGTVEAKWIQIGKTVFGRFFFKLGSTSSVGTGPTITLPIAPLASYYTTFGTAAIIGYCRYTVSAAFFGSVVCTSATVMTLETFASNAAYVTETQVTAAIPDTFTTGSSMFIEFSYETA